jgi:acetyl-CoA synthetase
MSSREAFLAARDLLLRHRAEYTAARDDFRWPALGRFNWARDHFDVLGDDGDRPALRLVRPDGTEAARTFAQLRRRSNQVANGLLERGARRGDRLLVMLPNLVPLWEVLLGAMKLGVVVIPATPQLTRDDLRDRLARGQARHLVTDPSGADKLRDLRPPGVSILIGAAERGWTSYDDLLAAPEGEPPVERTVATDPLLLYFTSGTTARPKLVLHTHASYPVGHLSTMYWLGLRPGDVHLNVSSPGWAKHAWSSVFAPWNAGGTVVVYDAPRFEAREFLATVERAGVTSLCAPPTVWRMLVNEDLASYRTRLREVVSAGEPLNPEVIDRVERAWGLTIRDGYGQTETTALVGNSPGQPVKPGSMGRPLPGYRVELLGPDGRPGDEGEIAIAVGPDRPVGLMAGYLDDPDRMARAEAEGFYRTGDVAVRDADGFITYVGRADDVFKSSDYRISPFELESVLIEHPAVAEAAVVESPDPIRLSVPKAFVALRPGYHPSRELAGEILAFARERLAPFKRVRRLEFADLPKTISGKIRRVDLRTRERGRAAGSAATDFSEEEFRPSAGSPRSPQSPPV